MKYLVIFGFIAIIGSLVAALVFMMRGDRAPGADGPDAPRNNHMARALAFRIGFSVLLFAIVLLSYFMGWIQPTGLPVTR
ncbi:MAG: twin transmembrane helix small protein [Burkholderiales bacterium]|nr:MAG: twin transmembrane helix small protein [Burkholderiales bacterium]